MKIKSFKLKLIISYILITVFSFGILALFLDNSLESISLRDIKTSLVNQAYLIQSQITAASLKKDNLSSFEELVKFLGGKIDCRITIINRQGEVLADSNRSLIEISAMENHLSRPEVTIALAGNTGINTRYSSTLKIDMLYVALPLKDKDQIVGILRLALPLTNIDKMLWEVRKVILMGLFIALVLALIIGSIMASKITIPINKMIGISRNFAKGDFSRKIFVSSSDEIGELSRTLNNMAEDLESKIKEIKTHNQHLVAIFQSMIEGVIVLDKSGRVISFNSTVSKIFNIQQKDAQGKLFLEVIRNNDIFELINKVLSRGEFITKDLDLVWPVNRSFSINATPVFENDSVSGCLVVIHDITEIKKLENMRRDFVANASHELKTPLTSIKGFVETLLDAGLDDKKNSLSFLKIIQDHTDRLNNLINDLLSLSHLESKEIRLNKVNLNLREQVEGVILGFKSQLKKREIEIKNELADSIAVTADKNRLEQVFTNLIDNAIKFNKEKGFIRISSEETSDKVKITIEDSGIGIPEKDIHRIFERFYRVDKARSRELGGTGLGLSIVKHIIESHGGLVGVESTEGLGSKFWFVLPK